MRAKGFFCNLDVLYEGLGIGKLKVDPKKIIFISDVNFLVMKTLDPDWIRIGIQPKMLDLDPDPYQMKTDPKACFKHYSTTH